MPYVEEKDATYNHTGRNDVAPRDDKSSDDRAGKDKPRESVFEFADLSAYSFKQRALIRAADVSFYTLIASVGRTVRFEVEGWEHWEAASVAGQVPIYCSWHEQIFLSTYFWRNRRIVVVTSQSFDGEYIARFIQRFGYGAARGSSTRGGASALVRLIRQVRAGNPAGFTIDGPKGARRVAKMGAVLLAKKTGQPVLPFAVLPERFRRLSSWDKMQIPLPFTRAKVSIARPIYVSQNASDTELEAKRDELQSTLDCLNA